MASELRSRSLATRRGLSVAEKVKLLNLYDALPKNMSQRSATEQLKISQSLLNKLLKTRHELEVAPLRNENTDRKRK